MVMYLCSKKKLKLKIKISILYPQAFLGIENPLVSIFHLILVDLCNDVLVLFIAAEPT